MECGVGSQMAPAVSTIALVSVTVYVMIGAVKDLKSLRTRDANAPAVEVNVTVMWVFAAINLVLDFGNIALFVYKKDEEGKWQLNCGSCCKNSDADGAGEDKENLNMKSALAHVAADTARSVAVLASQVCPVAARSHTSSCCCCCCCSAAAGLGIYMQHQHTYPFLAPRRTNLLQIAGLYAAFSPADNAEEADAIAAVIVSIVIAGSVFPLLASVF